MKLIDKIVAGVQSFFKGIDRLVHDTLKNPKTGNWSRKNVTGFIAFTYTIVYCSYGQIYDKTIHEFVVLGFLGAAISCLGISSWEKVNIKKAETAEPLEGGV